MKREADEQRKQQEQLAEELLSIRRKNQQDEINLMEDGTEKKLVQIDLDYQKELDAIESAREKAKKDGIYGQQSPLLDEAEENAFKRYQQAVTETHKQEAEAQAEAMRNYLKEYGTFQQQKLAIAEEYAEKIRKAQSEGERLSLEKNVIPRFWISMSKRHNKTSIGKVCSVIWEQCFGNRYSLLLTT